MYGSDKNVTRRRPPWSDRQGTAHGSAVRPMADAVCVIRYGERRDSVDPHWASTADRVHDPPLTDLGGWGAGRPAVRRIEGFVRHRVRPAVPRHRRNGRRDLPGDRRRLRCRTGTRRTLRRRVVRRRSRDGATRSAGRAVLDGSPRSIRTWFRSSPRPTPKRWPAPARPPDASLKTRRGRCFSSVTGSPSAASFGGSSGRPTGSTPRSADWPGEHDGDCWRLDYSGDTAHP